MELLYDFNSIKVDLNVLIDLIGTTKPREYSISSHQTEGLIGITVGLTATITPFERQVFGTCSSFLTGIKEGHQLRFNVQKGQFGNITRRDNLVIVATGTGIAPFRNLVIDRYLNKEGKNEKVILFYGCRKREEDYLYGDELEKIASDKGAKLFCNQFLAVHSVFKGPGEQVLCASRDRRER